jgi:3-oxoacyl-[acyl-carrier-protein] synthase II
MQNERRVVITGIGPVTPCGVGREAFFNSLKNAKSGITWLDNPVDAHGMESPVKLGGEIKNFNIEDYFSDAKLVKGMQKDMDKVSQFAMVAAKMLVEDAGLDFSALEAQGISRERVATFVGTGIGGIQTTCDDAITLKERGLRRLGLRSIIRLMPNAASGHIGINWGLQGRAKSDATACASGLDSFFDAYWYIKNGLADIMLTGGAEACLNTLALSSFYNMTALSRRAVDNPEEASCPFDKRRDGFIMSEGALLFSLEELSVAQARGAKIYAEVVGVGASCDAYHITAPAEDGNGGARAIKMALESAGLLNDREAIDFVSAHGTSTPLNDARETAAVKSVFGEHAYKLAMSSTKSMTGHLIGAAGPVALAASVLAVNENILSPTINYTEADPECDLDYVPNQARNKETNYSIAQALGFGGHNTCAIVKKFSA